MSVAMGTQRSLLLVSLHDANTNTSFLTNIFCGFFFFADIDFLARNGMKFTQFYSAYPLCTPSRSGLMTGIILTITCNIIIWHWV